MHQSSLAVPMPPNSRALAFKKKNYKFPGDKKVGQMPRGEGKKKRRQMPHPRSRTNSLLKFDKSWLFCIYMYFHLVLFSRTTQTN